MEKLEMWICFICKNLFRNEELWRFDGQLTCDPCIEKKWRVRQYPKIRKKVLERDKFTCQMCLETQDKINHILEVDHIIPRAEGGTDDMDNLRTLCFPCHRTVRHGKGIGTKSNNSFPPSFFDATGNL